MAPVHDTFKTYSFFHYFIQNIQNGVFPLWSPHTHCGEPFWTYIQFVGLLNPPYTLIALFAKITGTQNYPMLFSWAIFLHIFIFGLGCVLLLKRWAPKQDSVGWLAVTPIIVFGTVSVSAWLQGFGTFLIITFVPWILLFFDKSVADYPNGNWVHRILYGLTLAVFISFQLNSSNPAFFIFNTLFAILPLLILRAVERYGKRQGILQFANTCLWTLPFVILFSLPALSVFATQKSFYPIGRIQQNSSASQKAGFSAEDNNENAGTPGRVNDLLASFDIMNQLYLFPKDSNDDILLPFLFIERTSAPSDQSEIPILLGPLGFILFIVGFLDKRARSLSSGVGIRAIYIFMVFVALFGGIYTFGLIRHLEFFMSYVFFYSLFIVADGFRAVELYFNRKVNQKELGSVLCALSLLSSALVFPHHMKERLQEFPQMLKKSYPYSGKNWSDRRVYQIPPINPGGKYHDESKSHGEPLLFYQDSVVFFDRATQFTMPFALTSYLSSHPIDQIQNSLGITENKLHSLSGQGQIEVIGFDANHLSIKVHNSPLNDKLLYSQNYFPGWVLQVNSKKEALLPSSTNPFSEILLHEGENDISIRYWPFWIVLGYILNYLGQFSLPIFLVFLLYFERQKSTSLSTNH